jgi:hypothetical protein
MERWWKNCWLSTDWNMVNFRSSFFDTGTNFCFHPTQIHHFSWMVDMLPVSHTTLWWNANIHKQYDRNYIFTSSTTGCMMNWHPWTVPTGRCRLRCCHIIERWNIFLSIMCMSKWPQVVVESGVTNVTTQQALTLQSHPSKFINSIYIYIYIYIYTQCLTYSKCLLCSLSNAVTYNCLVIESLIFYRNDMGW